MPSTCVVPYCSSKVGGHKFPRDRLLREKWITAIRRVNFSPSEYSIVCKNHFRKEDYRLPKESILNNPAPILKKDSVPSKFSWNEHNLGKLRKTQRKIFVSQRCSVLQCKSGSAKNVILHACPSQETVRKKWAEVFKVNREIVKNMLICSHHFLKTDYIKTKNGESRILKQNAVPSQKLPRSTRIVHLRKKVVQTKKKVVKPKIIKKEEKMTEPVEEEKEVDEPKETRECRTCLRPMGAKSSACNIFQSWAIPWTGMEDTIAGDLAKLANVEVNDMDNHSKVICEPCYHKLLQASTFAARVRSTDQILRQRFTTGLDNADKVWPKPIQVDKNLNGDVFQEMDVEIKQEIVSDEEYNAATMENSYTQENGQVELEIGEMEIKIEPEEFVEPPPLTITINGTMSLNPSSTDSNTIVNGFQEYEAIISDGVQHATLTNGTDHEQIEQPLEATVKEEPVSEEEDIENVPGLSLDCILCTKSFNSVTGLKAHVIAQHSYKSVKRKAGSGESPEKKPKDEYKCEICRRYFVTSTDLMVHETCHNKHSCYGCSRKFDTFKQLSKHRKRCRAPLSQTQQKPKTLDDVVRPVKEEKTESESLGTPENSNDSSMKLHLEVHSANNDTQTHKTETGVLDGIDNDASMDTLNEDCAQ